MPGFKRELVVVVDPAVRLRASATGLKSLAGLDVSSLYSAISAAGGAIRPLFGASEDELDQTKATLSVKGALVPALSHYYAIDAQDERLEAIAAEVTRSPVVTAAYVKPAASLAGLNDMQPKSGPAPANTPDYSVRQSYLDPAPGGIDARYAWTVPGGNGAGVNIADIEGGWNFGHEDLRTNQLGLIAGVALTSTDAVNHGTAVIGVFSGDGIGVDGICPAATVMAVAATGTLGTAGAIRAAADHLSPGDLVLIELQRAGPRWNAGGDQGSLPLEWWPDDYDAVRYATAKGVIVVASAGNGSENLDDPFYNAPAAGFPAGWSNPFARGARDSGSILVGAGCPPANTHGSTWGPDRSRLDFSNYGAAVDVQGWGREVTTTGYGDLQGGADPDFWYTDRFSGTSSAAAMIVGVLGSVQGVKRAQGAMPLTPAGARSLLRTTGSPQQDALPYPATQRIGNRPDLKQMLGGGGAVVVDGGVKVPLHRYWNAQIPDHFYTTNWAELGGGGGAWQYEGIACYVHNQQDAGTVPLFRYWNSTLGDHFFTTDYSELGAGKFGWVYEGPGCYVHDQPGPGLAALHRYWNSNGRDHFYTTDYNQLGSGAFGWVYEKVQCYVHTSA